MSAEIWRVLITLGEKMTEEVEMLAAGHKDSNGCISCEELARMALSGGRHRQCAQSPVPSPAWDCVCSPWASWVLLSQHFPSFLS